MKTHVRTYSGIFSLIVLFLTCVHGFSRQVSFTIFHTTDLHGFVRPSYTYDGREHVGGVLRLASLLREQRSEVKNSLYIDCGDLTQGSIESYLTGGKIIVQALESLECDAWVIGNHEFDWGAEALGELMASTTLSRLAANIVQPDATEPVLPDVKPYTIFNIEGVDIGVIGLTTPGIPNWTRPSKLAGLRFDSSLSALADIIPVLREKADVIILAMHQGMGSKGDDHANQVREIAASFPEIDLMLGGHSHRVVESETVNGVAYAQAGYHANWLGRVDLVFDTARDDVVMLDSKVIRLEEDQSEDPELLELLKKELRAANRYSAKKIGVLQSDFPGMSPLPGHSAQQTLISRAIKRETGADFVLHGSFHRRIIKKGDFNRADLWRMVPYENEIGLLQVTKTELKSILEENAARRRSFSFMGNLGFVYELHVDEEAGQQVKNIRLSNGDPLHPRKRYTLALNSYVLASGGTRFPQARRMANDPIHRLKWSGSMTREMVEDYIEATVPLLAEVEKGLELVRRKP